MKSDRRHAGTPAGVPAVRAILLAALLTLAGHYAWELAQAQSFQDHAGRPLPEYAMHCFLAALGDLAIAAIAYAAAAAAFRRPSWPAAAAGPGRGWIGPAAVWMAVGLAATAAFEVLATSSGLWAYGPSMPTVFGVGVLPLLQWVVVPLATLAAFRALAARRTAPPPSDLPPPGGQAPGPSGHQN